MPPISTNQTITSRLKCHQYQQIKQSPLASNATNINKSNNYLSPQMPPISTEQAITSRLKCHQYQLSKQSPLASNATNIN
jgi:hypothetical protein